MVLSDGMTLKASPSKAVSSSMLPTISFVVLHGPGLDLLKNEC
jgi:hypothetical protein